MINSKPNFEIQPRRHDFLLYSGKKSPLWVLAEPVVNFPQKVNLGVRGGNKILGENCLKRLHMTLHLFKERLFLFCVPLSRNMNHHLRILLCDKKELKGLLLNADFERLFTNECRTTELMLSTIPQFQYFIIFIMSLFI